jgi:glycosyltransferase involved in cell wall biosynthesis
MSITSVVVVAYNNVELVKSVIESVKENTTGVYELIIVDNHSPDQRTRDYIRSIDGCVLFDPGQNIGCHKGFSFGFEKARGDYLVKLDDDTIIKTSGWNDTLIYTIEAWDRVHDAKIAFIAPDSNVKHGSQQVLHQVPFHELVFQFSQVQGGTLGFSCVMIPRKVYLEFGPLVTMDWHNGALKDSLYGGEELYYAQKAFSSGKIFGYAMNASVEHLGNEYRDLDYVLWKYIYGYLGWTTKSLEELKKDREMLIRGYTYWITSSGNGWLMEKGHEALKKLIPVSGPSFEDGV